MNRSSFRVWFLLIIACVALHLSRWQTAVVLIGYAISEYVDERQVRKARAKVLEDVISGWEPCKDDPEVEENAQRSRDRLVGQNHIIVIRIAELLSRMP